MHKQGVSGGLLSVNSLIDKRIRISLTDSSMVKTSSTWREAAKTGLLSLYADAEKTLEKYKDFDIVKEMESRNGANLLWVRARSIDANVVNSNGDYFSEEELTKENDYQGKKMPAYKTFEGVPIYTNHENSDINKAKGMVVYAEWDDEQKCVYCVFFIDEDAYPDLARGVRQGYVKDVSMGCSVDYGICSICDNKSVDIKDYCDCLKKYKGRTHPSGKKAFEYNYGIKFIELSCVGDGAFESCEIEELYDQDDLIKKAETVIKKAQSVSRTISVAAAKNIRSVSERSEYEKALRQVESLTKEMVKIAQTAGTLVGGQLLGGSPAQNATVVKVLQGLGIDPSTSLNILDLVNLALNFLEVAVLNLFSKQENIDLGHVAKLTKAMGELQNTLQDMIDDGLETTGGSNTNVPMMPAQTGQQPQNPSGAPVQPAPQQPTPAPQQPQQNTQQTLFSGNPLNFNPSVGTLVAPGLLQPGAVTANNLHKKFIWAGEEESDTDENKSWWKQ